jgi:hypothetical protein
VKVVREDQLPSQSEIFEWVLAELDKARSSLSDAGIAMGSDWQPLNRSLPSAAGDARSEIYDQIGIAKAAIDKAKGEAYRALKAIDNVGQ